MTNTQFREHQRFFSGVGSGIKILYCGEYDKSGAFHIVEKGKDNLYAYIQSFKDSCDIYAILKRFENGDVTALNQAQGMYGDFSQMPKSYAEMLNAIYNAETWFKGLSKDVRAKFDNDPQKFIASMDSPDFLRMVGLVTDVQENLELTSASVSATTDLESSVS